MHREIRTGASRVFDRASLDQTCHVDNRGMSAEGRDVTLSLWADKPVLYRRVQPYHDQYMYIRDVRDKGVVDAGEAVKGGTSLSRTTINNAEIFNL